MSPGGRSGPTLVVLSSAALIVALLVGVAAAGSGPASPARPSASVDFVNVSATSNYQFQPSEFYVYPGALVELAVTQLADFPHTFTLSSERNQTISTSLSPAQLYQYFVTNPPILNLSLGSTVGTVTRASFTAPEAGFYEFVCTEPGHFQSGMRGFMNSTTTPPTSGSSSGSNLTTYLIVGVVAAAIVIAAVAVVVRRRARGPSGPAPPTAPT